MTKIIEDLCRDHRNMARLLDLLGRELKTFKNGESPDYGLVLMILDYCINYPNIYHHPREDLVYDRLRLRNPEAATVIGDLRTEHDRLSGLTQRFAVAVGNVLEDETLPRDWFLSVANDYLTFSRNHMQMEEVLFYPAARRSLKKDDWRDIGEAAEAIFDPLFGDEPEEKYRALYQYILEWDEAPGAQGANS